MDRQIVYPASIPLDTDILNAQRDAMIALGYLAQMTLGLYPVVEGLGCTPTSPASMSIVIGPGCILQNSQIDATPFGSLPASTNPLVKIGVNVASQSFPLSAPTISGDSICYLIEAAFGEADGAPIVLPYYNATNPSQPYSGPSNDGQAQNTQRLQFVQLQVKAGAPSQTGTQQVPGVDEGWVGLWIVTVSFGATEIDANVIAQYPTAPFIPYKLPTLSPGTHMLQAFNPATQGNWVAPTGTTVAKIRLWGGGGAGGGGVNGTAGGGGGGGGYAEGFVQVTPGQVIPVSVGNGGAGIGSPGGNTSFGVTATVAGGAPGGNGSSGVPGAGGAGGGAASSSPQVLCQSASAGGSAFTAGGSWLSGAGGSSFAGAGAPPSSSGNGVNGSLPGAGGSGGVDGNLGGFGGAGLALVEW